MEHDSIPPRFSRLELAQDLNRWQLVKPAAPKGEQRSMAILVGIVVAIGSLVGLFKSGVTSGDGEIAIFVFWGVLALVFSVQLFFMFRNYASNTTVLVEHGLLKVTKCWGQCPQRSYQSIQWRIQNVEAIESIRSKRRGRKTKQGYVRIDGVRDCKGCRGCGNRKQYDLFKGDTACLTNNEFDWVAQVLGKHLDVEVKIPPEIETREDTDEAWAAAAVIAAETGTVKQSSK